GDGRSKKRPSQEGKPKGPLRNKRLHTESNCLLPGSLHPYRSRGETRPRRASSPECGQRSGPFFAQEPSPSATVTGGGSRPPRAVIQARPRPIEIAPSPVGGAVSFEKAAANAYLGRMFKAFEFCLPTNATNVPAGPEWLHEIK